VNEQQINRLRASFDAITPRTPELADRFHTRLLAQNPGLRPMFPRDLNQQKQDFAAGLRLVVKNMHVLESLEHTLLDIGARHARAGVTPGHYGVARDVLIATMREIAGPAWTEQLSQDWSEALNGVISIFVVGAARSRAHAA